MVCTLHTRSARIFFIWTTTSALPNWTIQTKDGVRVLFNRIVLSEKGKKKGKKDQGRIRFLFPLIGRPLVDQPGSDVSLELSVELPCEDEYNGYARCKPAGHESGRAARGASGG